MVTLVPRLALADHLDALQADCRRLATARADASSTASDSRSLQELDRAAGQEVEDQHLAAGHGRDVHTAFAIHNPTFGLAVEARRTRDPEAQVNLAVRVTVAPDCS